MELNKLERDVIQFCLLNTVQSLNRCNKPIQGLNKKFMLDSIEKILKKFK